MKASAVAHPIQGLVKYHGLRDPVRRIPFHNSISVSTGPIATRTTVEVLDGEDGCQATIDGQRVQGRALERVMAVVDAVREGAEDDRPFRMESRNDFPQFVGLGSSSSGFAALAMAAAEAYGWHPGTERLSQVARLGAGSAARALTGGISEWKVERERSWSEQLAGPDAFPDWRIVVPLVEHPVVTENVHHEVISSPLFQGRLDSIEPSLAAAREALATGDPHGLWAVAERDTLNLHAVTMTGDAGLVVWQPATIAVIHAVRALRASDVPAWFSIDTGATAYINTEVSYVDQVRSAVEGIDGVVKVMDLEPAGGAHSVDDHLF